MVYSCTLTVYEIDILSNEDFRIEYSMLFSWCFRKHSHWLVIIRRPITCSSRRINLHWGCSCSSIFSTLLLIWFKQIRAAYHILLNYYVLCVYMYTPTFSYTRYIGISRTRTMKYSVWCGKLGGLASKQKLPQHNGLRFCWRPMRPTDTVQ